MLGGQVTDRTIEPREILADPTHVVYDRARVMDKDYSFNGSADYPLEILAGTFIALLPNGNVCPCKRSKIASGGGADKTTSVLVDAAAFQVGDTVTIGADDVTISAINYGTNTITHEEIDTADNDAVFGRGDLAGSGDAIGILNEFVDLYDRESQTSVARGVSAIVVHGEVQDAMLLGDKAAIIAADVAGDNNLKLIRIV